MNILRFDSLESTNRYCEALDLSRVEDFTCFWAEEQTAGIGQRGNHWHSAPRENLTFSVVLHPAGLPAERQFRLTQALSLALCDLLDTAIAPRKALIKWPNDIYVEGCKISGTLVSTRLSGRRIGSAICGIGLNVNQTRFPDWVPNPTSLRLLTGRHHDPATLLQALLQHIEDRCRRWDRDLDTEYLGRLLNMGQPAQYIYQGDTIGATITGIDPYGHLLLQAADGQRLRCAMKEIALLH